MQSKPGPARRNTSGTRPGSGGPLRLPASSSMRRHGRSGSISGYLGRDVDQRLDLAERAATRGRRVARQASTASRAASAAPLGPPSISAAVASEMRPSRSGGSGPAQLSGSTIWSRASESRLRRACLPSSDCRRPRRRVPMPGEAVAPDQGVVEEAQSGRAGTKVWIQRARRASSTAIGFRSTP